MPQPYKILILSITRMGDIIQSIPFFRRLRIKHPGAEIHVLVEGCFADVAKLIPGVDKVHVVTLEELLPCLSGGRHADLTRAVSFYAKFVGDLRRENFSEVWNLTHTRPSMVLNHLLAGEQGEGVTLDRDGLQLVNAPWMMYFYATNLARPWCQVNLVDIYANCVDGIEWSAGRDLSLNRPTMPLERPASGTWIAIHAGASQSSKQWPVSHYREVAHRLSQYPGAEIVLIGSRGDARLAEAFADIPKVRNLIGKTSIPQLTDLLSRCRLLLSNDSGPMHVAAAVGTRVIDITVGSALASETAPYGEGHLVVEPDSECFPCSPSGTCPAQHCASRITPDAIASLAEWELGWRAGVAPDDLAGCRVYRTHFSSVDGLLELTRLFSHATCERDELNNQMRATWLSVLAGRHSAARANTRPIPPHVSAAAAQAGDIALQIQDLAAQIATAAPRAGCSAETLQRWGGMLVQHETRLRDTLSAHGLLRSLLAFTDIARASLTGNDLEAQASETARIYRRLNHLLEPLASTGCTPDANQLQTIELPEEAHEISLNGLELARRAENDQTVGEVLAELRTEIHAAGKIITQVVLDGHPLPDGWQRRQRLSAPVSSARTLELAVQEPLCLKQQTLRDAATLADRLVRQTKPLSRKFRLGDEVTANNELAAFLDDLKLVLAGLDHSTRQSEKVTNGAPVRDRIMESASRLLPSLDRLYKAQAGGDYIAVADELEYDLCEQISAWEPLLSDAGRALEAPMQAR